MVKVGIVGTGYTIGIAKQHISAYKGQSNAEIVAVYDLIKSRAEDYIQKHEITGAVACDSYEQLLDMVDAVSICTPNDTHVPLSAQALKAGKHVLCEKPFAPHADDCVAAMDIVKDTNLVNMIGLCYRGIPAYRFVKKLIADGELGKIFHVRLALGGNRMANPDVKREWRMHREESGSGVTADFGSHMLDMTDMLFSDVCGKIVEVQCMQGTCFSTRKGVNDDADYAVDNDDVAVFSARLASGTIASYTASRVGCSHTMEIYCEKGSVVFNGNDPFALEVQLKGLNEGKKIVMSVPEELYQLHGTTPTEAFKVNFMFEIDEFITAIENGTQVTSDFARGLYIQKLLDCLQESADTKQVVSVDF